ncbi:hypothetical protein JS73_08215 [Synergistes jonesii]|uniref:Uncharacterized protein n=1 Tax=Synergistes jonesii TaxID=2754 RepID=A0A073IR56_9BACT|nr:hypothetical protein EH55_06105 [Synergistes jonesii]OFB61906.1 hypothetical protein JS72_09390 [Synergistes jonesii]OFB62235.1 hypothetical protein JS73_08215 [Synergistes jonesii]OFB62964.1 hypothetical protein JS79_08685 [Synergistes jonesii]OFB67470.1 hypothetical protein JS78_08225 [Synergistes jonesii]
MIIITNILYLSILFLIFFDKLHKVYILFGQLKIFSTKYKEISNILYCFVLIVLLLYAILSSMPKHHRRVRLSRQRHLIWHLR